MRAVIFISAKESEESNGCTDEISMKRDDKFQTELSDGFRTRFSFAHA